MLWAFPSATRDTSERDMMILAVVSKRTSGSGMAIPPLLLTIHGLRKPILAERQEAMLSVSPLALKDILEQDRIGMAVNGLASMISGSGTRQRMHGQRKPTLAEWKEKELLVF